ncbi:MAG: TonB-dependent receptor [Deltaproteobacteria bacterium]|jgi:iron complex outermembrane receptor protein|nr:TonB-dependent receptor [Deltaproteobacteria bacterium]
MKRFLLGSVIFGLVLAGGHQAWAQELGEVRLDPIELSVPKDTVFSVTQTDIERKDAQTMWEALSGVPGVTIAETGGRSEGIVSIRGSNERQVGVYIDDIPVATTYRNQFDFNDVLMFDTESIDVSKGYSSPLLNGGFGNYGTLNVKTHKPVRPLEFKAQYMNYFDRKGDDQGRFMGVRIGTKQDLFYLQVSAIQDEQDFFTLSNSFRPGFFQKSGRRVNSDFRNRRLNVIAGLTPSDKVEIMFGAVLQDYVKGQPVTAEPDPASKQLGISFGKNAKTRLWRWPVYKTQRYFVKLDADVGEKTHVQLLGYYDKHEDLTLTYTKIVGLEPKDPDTSSDSGYHQYIAGISGRFDHEINKKNKISWSVGFRQLSHKSKDYNSGVILEHDQDHYFDLGTEYTYKPINNLTAVLGLSYSRRIPDTAEELEGNTMVPLEGNAMNSEDLFNWQLGLFYDLPNAQQIYLTYARKGRFPSMWEKFTRFGDADNPHGSFNLKPEKVDHYELGYRGTMGGWLKFSTAVFYSSISNKITRVSIDNNNYFQNADKVKTYGFETGLEAIVNQYLSLGGTFTLMDWKTEVTDKDEEYLMDTPKVQGSLFAVVAPMEKLTITAQAVARSNFYQSSSSSDKHPEAPGFLTADLKVAYDFNDHITVELGAKNIFDKNYYYSYDFPRPGRTFFLGVTGNY